MDTVTGESIGSLPRPPGYLFVHYDARVIYFLNFELLHLTHMVVVLCAHASKGVLNA